MSSIASNAEDLILNADGGSSTVKIKINGTEKASISSAGAFTSTTIDATALTGNLPAISGANLTNLPSTSTADILSAATIQKTATNNIGVGSGAVDSITTGDHNTGVGVNALTANTEGSNNVALGYLALRVNTTGAQNVAIGAGGALGANTTASYNVGIGYAVLSANTTGAQNTAVGYNALAANTTGERNVAVGEGALDANTTGIRNVAIGRAAISGATTASYNTGVGHSVLGDTTTGYNNTAIGYGVLNDTTTGSHNTCVGFQAGAYSTANTTGNSNVIIGAYSRGSTANAMSQIVLGVDVASQGDSQFTFGKVGNRVYNDFATNASWTRSSDERKKTNIVDATLGLDFINDLSTKTFKWKRSQDMPNTFIDYDADTNHMDTDVTMYGMLAQDVKAALDTAGVTTFGGWKEESDGSQSLSQEMFIYPLIKAIQELSAKVKALEEA